MSPPPSTGLSSADAARLLQEQGPNEVEAEAKRPAWRELLAQLESPVVLLLLGAALISGLLREVADAVAIATIVVINALVGFFQERRAEQAIAALRSMTAPKARVLRDGRSVIVAARELVVGDLLLLEAGDVVAADAQVIEAHALLANEAALTGESMPVTKTTAHVAADAPLAERSSSLFMGTAVVSGAGKATVSATGMRTEIGKIAHLLSTATEEETPLEQRLAKVTRVLIFACAGIVLLVAGIGLFRGLSWLEVLLSSVSLAVAAVPEGLPAIVTIALAVGVQRMAQRRVLVRRLPAVETLGCATVICTDKTGTLTTGSMRVRELFAPDETALLDAAAACVDAELDGAAGIGDPTEVAILLAAEARGILRPAIEASRPRVDVEPFDSATKRMAIARADGVRYVKGAVEVILPRCVGDTAEAQAKNLAMAERGLRVLAVATAASNDAQESLVFKGLIGIADPPRPEAIAAVNAAWEAGVHTVMITGDHPTTARAIAAEMGILRPGDRPEDRVHARATPEEKLQIVRALKATGQVVAMTGDGVNDAPALREAHIGIAMGKGGTEVAREASDMVLADDNFASIVAAIAEGRGIFDNIQKALVYLLAGNLAELAVMLGAALVGAPLPLLPLHLLWINLVTDGFPALALVVDPADPGAMKHPPRRPDSAMLGPRQWRAIAWTAALQTAATLGVFVWALQERDLIEARTLAFYVLVFGELLRAFAARSPTRTLFEVGVFSNLRLLGVVLVSMGVQLALHAIPWTRDLFELSALSAEDRLLALGLGALPVTIVELTKLLGRALSAARPPRP